jgi:hypothetical protein
MRWNSGAVMGVVVFVFVVGMAWGCSGHGYGDPTAADGNGYDVNSRLKREPDRSRSYEDDVERNR